MKRYLSGLIFLVALLTGPLGAATSAIVRADILVLVPGYLGSSASWRSTGIVAALNGAGWRDAGNLALAPGGVRYFAPPYKIEGNRAVTVELDTLAPVLVQAGMLVQYIAFLHNRFPDEKLILAGHSAGGVVARAMMVRYPGFRIKALITIAAPHLGTPLAATALSVTNSPIGWFSSMMGANVLNISSGLYYDLLPERPGNFLGWLNSMPHPQAKYISVVRIAKPGAPWQGDDIVPAILQDMRNIRALRGRARSIVAPGLHALYITDAALLAGILKSL